MLELCITIACRTTSNRLRSYSLSERIQPQAQSGQVSARAGPPQTPQSSFSSPPPPSKDDRLPSKDLSEAEHDTVDEWEDEVDSHDSGDPGDRAVRRRGEQRKREARGLVRRSGKRRRGGNGSDLDLVLLVLGLFFVARFLGHRRARGGSECITCARRGWFRGRGLSILGGRTCRAGCRGRFRLGSYSLALLGRAGLGRTLFGSNDL